jgi:hypothetical protein
LKPALMYKAFSLVAWRSSVWCQSNEPSERLLGQRTHWMHTKNRMAIPHWLPADEMTVPSRILSLPEAMVLDFQTFEQTLDGI